MGRTADGDTFGNRLFDGEKLQEFLGKDVAQHTCYDDDDHRNRNMTTQLLRNADTDRGSDALRQEANVGRMVEMEDEGENEHGAETRQHARNNADQHSPIILLQKLNLLIKWHSQTDGGWCEQIADAVGACRIGLVIYASQQERDDDEDDGDEQRVHKRPSRLQLQQHAYAVGCQTDENAEEDRILEQLVHFFASFPFLITNCVIQPEAPITTKVLTTVTTIYWNHALPIS